MTVMYFMNDNLLFFSQLALEASSCLYRIAYIIEMIKENTKPMRHPQIKYTSLQTHIRTYTLIYLYVFLVFEFEKFHIDTISY